MTVHLLLHYGGNPKIIKPLKADVGSRIARKLVSIVNMGDRSRSQLGRERRGQVMGTFVNSATGAITKDREIVLVMVMRQLFSVHSRHHSFNPIKKHAQVAVRLFIRL